LVSLQNRGTKDRLEQVRREESERRSRGKKEEQARRTQVKRVD